MSSKQFLQQLVLDRKIPDWCHRLVMDDDLEVKANPYMEIVPMPLDVREKFWSFTSELLGERDAHSGISSLACRLFERYCSNFVSKCDQMSSSEWENAKRGMTKKIALLMAICISLAYKVQSSKYVVSLQGKVMTRTLRARGHKFTPKEFFEAKLDVFAGIDYFVPLWSNWQKAQMLASKVGLSMPTVHGAGALMDLIDFKLPVIREQYINFMASAVQPTSNNVVDADIRNAHLISSVVVASARYMEPQGLELTIILARWTRGSVYAIECLGQVIYRYFLDCVVNKERISKASKHPSDPCSMGSSKRPRPNLNN